MKRRDRPAPWNLSQPPRFSLQSGLDTRHERRRRSMASNQDLFDLFHRKLREMWFAEKRIHASLPKMANAAKSDALRAAFKKHEAETQGQMSRLGTVFGLIDRSAKEEASIALSALLDECMEAAVKFKNSSALDAALIAGAQAVEHHEIACYGTLKAWADQLGMKEAAGLELVRRDALDAVAPNKTSLVNRPDNDPGDTGHKDIA